MKIPHGGRLSGVTATAMSLKPIEMELVASKQGPKVYFRTKIYRRTTSHSRRDLIHGRIRAFS
ncbi:hypothetical protein MES5069_300027 [Mesorhizobium escarrei]|uniref:Uncharacterized protein n=1 Tax=Mesorhizobium escarrei TaxID=666018 RepID=A0ABN8JWU0_9HYPH|nr:hypothetical protein MES5069_300027 [Mesorhizobium escarrei]